MLTFIVILIIVASLLLTLVVLIQNPKGGISSNFIAPSQVMGVKRSTDVIEKATWILAATLIVLSLLSNFFIPSTGEGESINDTRLKDEIENVTVAPPPAQAPMQQQQPAE
ncbi:MAG: preprotein translocase subunit SecG [Bacteroidia bacterium]